MTSNSYTIAWIIYLLAAGSLILAVWHTTRRWPSLLRQLLSAVLLVLLVTPYYSDLEQNKFAPAILISLFEFAFGDSAMGFKAATPLFLLLPLSIGLLLFYAHRRQKTK